MNKFNLVEVNSGSYTYVTCSCGKPLMVWIGELVHHAPFTNQCSDYIGVKEKPDKSQQIGLLEVME